MFYLKKQKGFTIVETMIVLGVTGVLFISVSLLISGQTERYRYRDSMYRLQQQVQAQINDVQTGQLYTDVAATDGKSNVELVGKRIIFCTKLDVSDWCKNPTADEDGIAPTNTQFRVNTTQYNPLTNKYNKYGFSQYIDIPRGIEFIRAKKANSSTTAIDHNDGDVLGFEVKYSDRSNKTGSLNTGIYSYIKYENSSNGLLSDANDGRAFLLCFEGYKTGSLELGSKELGNTVKLNLVDSRCD